MALTRKKVPRTRGSGTLTEAGFRGFIRSLLRAGSMRWKPRSEAKRNARHHEKLANQRGKLVYHSMCASCGVIFPESLAHVDHIHPVVNPDIGFTTWDDYIEALFCEEDNLQVLCKECHDKKTEEERKRR